MAVHFKFHTLKQLDEECRRLRLDLAFSDDLSPLFRPVRIGARTAGNAFCIQPMEGCDGTLDGNPDELTFRRARRFGAGGVKIVWMEAAAVLDEARANPRQLLVHPRTAGGLARLLAECRQAHLETHGRTDDLLVGLQLTHSGRYSHRRPLVVHRDPLLDPSTLSRGFDLLDDDRLSRLVDDYVAAARLAHSIGFDFIDVKQCHRYLLSELLSATTRPGRYGGSLENRTRLARDIIQAIRIELPDLAIATRLNVFDGIPHCKGPDEVGVPSGGTSGGWGMRDDGTPDLAEPLRWVAEMQRLGVAMVNVSMGNPYASPHIIRPFEHPPPDGYRSPEHPLVGVARHVRLAGEIQTAFPDLPIVGSGYSWLQDYFPHAAAANVRDGRIAIVGVGRAALAQPDFVEQLQRHGKLDRRRVCRTFSYCTALMRSKHNKLGQFATGCPPFDREAYGDLWEEARTPKE